MANGDQTGTQYEVIAPDGSVGTVSFADKGKVSGGYKLTGRVQMFSPEGVRGFVDPGSLREATKAGYQATPKTPFEKQRTEGPRGLLEGLKSSAGSLVPSIPETVEGGIKTALTFIPGGSPLVAGGQAREAVQRMMAAAERTKGEKGLIGATRPTEILATGLSGVVPGLNPEAQAERAEHADTMGVVGGNIIPVATAALAGEHAIRGKTALGTVASKVAGPESKLGKLFKEVSKSKVKKLEEAHAAEATKIESQYQKDLTAHQEEVEKIEQAHQKKLEAHAEREQRIEQRYQKRVAEHQAKTQELDLDYQKRVAEHQEKVKAAEADYQKRLTEHKQRVEQTKKDYAQEISEYQEKAKDVSRQQSMAEAKKGAAVQHQNNLAGLLKENLSLADEKIGSQLGRQFDAVHDAVEAKIPKINVEPVTKAAEIAKKGLLFEDSKKAFDSVLSSIEPEGGTVTAAKYSDLRKAYSKLNEYLYGGGEIPSDLYRAVKSARDSLGAQLQEAADSVGLGGKLSKAMRDWSEYKSIFHDKSAIAKGGSPIRRILDAEDPAFIVDQLKGKAGDRLIEEIGQYSKYGADKALAGRLKSFVQQVIEFPATAPGMPKSPARPSFPKAPEPSAMPKVPERSAAPKEPETPYKPKAPERREFPKPPEKPEFTPFDREAVAREILADRIKKGAWGAGGAGAAALLYHLIFGKDNSGMGAVP